MNKQDKDLLAQSLAHFMVESDKKVKAGFKEHGCGLTVAPGLLNELKGELIDAWQYYYAIIHQLKQIRPYLTHPKAIEVWERLMQGLK